jgi:Rrf2 family protein
MSVTSQFAVGVHILALLALNPDEPLTSELMAASVNTNPVVIRRILGQLREARLVSIQRGVDGGARLTHSLDEITLLAVYQAVEQGHIFPLHKQAPNPNCMVGANIQAVLMETFHEAELAMEQALAKVTVGQIVNEVVSRASKTA